MRNGQIVSLSGGGFGVKVARTMWQTLAFEHRLNMTVNKDIQASYGTDGDIEDNCGIFFEEVMRPSHKQLNDSLYYRARAVLFDLDTGALNEVMSSNTGNYFMPTTISHGNGSGNSYACARFDIGSEEVDIIMDGVRREVEVCDHLQGFQFHTALAGGTGSGLGALVLSRIKDEYPGIIVQHYALIPSENDASDIVLQPYNSILGLRDTIQLADAVVLLQNNHYTPHNSHSNLIHDNYLCNVSPEKYYTCGYEPQNIEFAHLMCDFTSFERFSTRDGSHCSIRKLCTNLVPYPMMNLLLPISSKQGDIRYRLSGSLHKFYHTSSILTATCVQRGIDANLFEVERWLRETSRAQMHASGRRSNDWLDCYLPLISQDNRGRLDGSTSVSIMANTTAVRKPLLQLVKDFDAMYRKKAYINAFSQHGMLEEDFEEARHVIHDVLHQYQTREAVGTGLEMGIGVMRLDSEGKEEESDDDEEEVEQELTFFNRVPLLQSFETVDENVHFDEKEEMKEKQKLQHRQRQQGNSYRRWYKKAPIK
jgi:tubulin beta